MSLNRQNSQLENTNPIWYVKNVMAKAKKAPEPNAASNKKPAEKGVYDSRSGNLLKPAWRAETGSQ
jgi:hypothetical protein